MEIGSKVKVTSGNPDEPSKFEGYYGEVTGIDGNVATVSHSPEFAGLKVDLAELVDDE